ncbi:MAG: AraC family transcriptional regulator, partial [Opitutales bacterium]|nr:AraC family transcriptional regulator [Opitutales bacterium]
LHLRGRTAAAIATLMQDVARSKGAGQLAALLRLLAEVADAPESDLALLSSRSFTLSAESHYQKAISKSVQHLVANFRDEIRLEDLLKISGLSRPTFARQFKQHSGHSFSTFVNELRLQAARRELRDSERSVLDIALACGFRQVTFFNRLFKREMKCTPVEYRRKQRKKGR